MPNNHIIHSADLKDGVHHIAATFLSSLDTIIRGDVERTLGSALSLVDSSHSAVFIFNNENKFQGLISPYRTIYSNNYPYTTKAAAIMFRPPNITKETPIYEVAEHMISTKVYTLPVFDNQGEPVGVIHAKVILQNILTDHGLLSSISKLINYNDPITSPINSLVGEVYQKLKKEGVSRIVLVDDKSKLVGIISRGDLVKAFIKPTSKNRFANEGTAMGYNSLAGEKKFRKDEPVRKYYTALVGSLSENSPRDKVVSTLVTSPHNSLVLVDKNNKPSGVLSIHDLLKAITRLKPKEDILLIIKKPSDSVTDKELESAREYLIRFGRKLKERMVINKIDVASEESKDANGQTIEFNTTVIVTPVAGKALVAVTKQRGFLDGIKEAIVLIEKQRRRSGLSKEETRKTQS